MPSKTPRCVEASPKARATGARLSIRSVLYDAFDWLPATNPGRTAEVCRRGTSLPAQHGDLHTAQWHAPQVEMLQIRFIPTDISMSVFMYMYT